MPSEFHLNEIVVLDDAAFDRRERRSALLHFRERVGHAFVGDGHFRHLDFHVLVVAQRKFRQHFKRGAEFQRLAFVVLQLVDLRLRNGCEFLFGDGLFDVFGNERLQHFALDVAGETLLDQRNRRFARTKAGHARDLGKILGDFFRGFSYFVGRDFQVQFFPASCFRHLASPFCVLN